MAGTDVTTIAAESEPLSSRGRPADEVFALCIAYCRDQPARVGEIGIVPADGQPSLLGRGEGDGKERRLSFFQQRAGTILPRGPIASPGVSRSQVEIRCDGEQLKLENVGAATLRVNGEKCRAGSAGPCDVIRIGQELVLLCTKRPARIAPPRDRAYPMGPFGEPDGCGILGESAVIAQLRAAIAFAAAADAHVLLLGESGTGKELTARAIHRLSARGQRALVARNAVTMPEGLIDAELFGNIRDYPNPGMPERKGLVGEADASTLFLDEIGELPSELQAHLLRVLDANGEYQRLGESKTRQSNFRLVAATNRHPSSLKGDLLPRFTLRIEVPGVAARLEDIPLIARHLVLLARAKAPTVVAPFVYEFDGRAEVRFDPRLIEALLRGVYPGNVRDLDSALWRAMSKSSGEAIEAPEDEQAPREAQSGGAAVSAPRESDVEPTVETIRDAMARCGGSVTRAARDLGLSSRYALYRLLRKHGIATASED